MKSVFLPACLLLISTFWMAACQTVTLNPKAYAELTRANNDFGLRLLQEEQTAYPDSNLLISPISVFSALSMTANGANGHTLTEMESTLGFGQATIDDINEEYRYLIEHVGRADNKVEVRLANSIWHHDDFSVRSGFLNTAKSDYAAEVEALDFADPGSPATINRWVDQATNGHIKEIIQQISSEQRMFLINALYFQGDWLVAFDEELVAMRPFRLADSSTVQLEQMISRETSRLAFANEEVEMVELLYGNGTFSMLLLKPRQESLADFLTNLRMSELESWMAQLSGQEINLQLPKLTLAYQTGLKDQLERMGMERAFSGGADFSNLSPQSVQITGVQHKTFLEMDERGTTAAAVTSVGIGVTSLPATPTFRFDSPYLLFLRERESGLIMFAGKILDPRP